MATLPLNFNKEKFLADFLVSRAIQNLSADNKLVLLQKINEDDVEIILKLSAIVEDEKKDLSALTYLIDKVVDEATFEALHVARRAKLAKDEATTKKADEIILENLLS